MRLDRKPFLLEILGAGVLGVTSVHLVSKRSLFLEICGGRSVLWDNRVRLERWGGSERTVASVEADDEAGLLLDFLRHVGGRWCSIERGGVARENIECAPKRR